MSSTNSPKPGIGLSYYLQFLSIYSHFAIGRGRLTGVKTGYRFIILMSNLLLYNELQNQSLTFAKSKIRLFSSTFSGGIRLFAWAFFFL